MSNFTWTGNGASSSASDPDNWIDQSGNPGVPGAGDSVDFPDQAIGVPPNQFIPADLISGDLDVASVTIEGLANYLSGDFNVSGDLAVDTPNLVNNFGPFYGLTLDSGVIGTVGGDLDVLQPAYDPNDGETTFGVVLDGAGLTVDGNVNLGSAADPNGQLLLENEALLQIDGGLNINRDSQAAESLADFEIWNSTVKMAAGHTVTDNGSLEMIGPAAQLITSQPLDIGDGGNGSFGLQEGATFTTVGDLVVGQGQGNGGLVTIQDGTLNVSGNLILGLDGANGSLRTADGNDAGTPSIINVAGNVVLGDGPNSLNMIALLGYATLNIEGGGSLDLGEAASSSGELDLESATTVVETTGAVTVGDAGDGELNLDGGGASLATAGDLALAAQGTATAYLNLEPDTELTVNGTLEVGEDGTATVEFYGGGAIESDSAVLGEFAGSDGTFFGGGVGYAFINGPDAVWSISSDLVVGDGGVGNLTLGSGGALSALVEVVGFAGSGVIDQQGGTNTVGPADGSTSILDPDTGVSYEEGDGTLYVGSAAGGQGNYDLEGGSLNATSIFVSNGSVFEFDGGTANFAQFGLYDTSEVLASGNEIIGTPTSPAVGSTFFQVDGRNTIAGALVLSDSAAATSAYDLDLGGLSALLEVVGLAGGAQFTQTGGINTVGPADGGFTPVLDADTGTSDDGDDSTLSVGSPGTGGTGTYDLQGGTLDAPYIFVAHNSTFKFDGGTANFSQFQLSDTSQVTASGDELIGTPTSPGGSSTFFQHDGSNTVAGALVLSDSATATGTYHIEAGSLSALVEVVGFAGGAQFTQTGGTNTVGPADGSTSILDPDTGVSYQEGDGTLYVGSSADGQGNYDLQGGSLNATSIFVSNGSVFEFDGGTANFAQFGLYDTSEVLASSNEVIGTPTGPVVGSAFFQVDGSNTIAGALVLSDSATAAARSAYDLDLGNLSALVEMVGFAGSATFTQTGGTNTVGPADGGLTPVFDADIGGSVEANDGTLFVGSTFTGGTGTYTLQNGTLDAPDITVAHASTFNFGSGTANFDQFQLFDTSKVTASGNELIGTPASPGGSSTFFQYNGSNTVAGALVLSDSAAATSAYNLQAGGLSALTEIVGLAGDAQFTQTGGTNTVGPADGGLTAIFDPDIGSSVEAVDGTLSVGSTFTGGTGTYDLQGGTLDAPTIFIATGSTFKFDGGTANFGQFLMHDTSKVTASGNEVIGTPASPGGSSTFQQLGGSNTIAGALVLSDSPGAAGTYDLQAGSLSANLELLGFSNPTDLTNLFNQTGGTNTIGPANGEDIPVFQPASGMSFPVPDGALDLNDGDTYDLQGGTLDAPAVDVGTGGTFEFDGGTANFGQLEFTGDVTASTSELVGTPTSPTGGSTVTQLGSNTIAGALVLSDSSSVTSTYELQAGSLSAILEEVGFVGTATFTQTGGTNTVGPADGGLTFVEDADSNVSVDAADGGLYVDHGTYDLKAGTLDAPDIAVTAAGTFKFDGGTANFSQFADSGQVTASGSELVGTPSSPAGGSTFTQYAGANTITGALVLSDSGTVAGTYDLQSGNLSAILEEVGFVGSGTFTQTGGTNTVGPADGGFTFVDDADSNVSIDAGDGGLYVGHGSYDLAGGTLNAPNIVVTAEGTFEFDGGAANFSLITNDGEIEVVGNTPVILPVAGNVDNENLIAVDNASLTIAGNLSGTGTVDVTDGYFKVDGSVSSGQTIKSDPSTIEIADPAQFAGTLELSQGDQLIVDGANGGSYANGAIVVTENGNAVATINAPGFSTGSFSFVPNGNALDITVGGDTSVPTVAAAGPYSGSENAPITLNGLSVGLTPSSNDPLSAVVSVSHGTLTVATGGGATIAGDGSASVSLSGTVEQIQAALTGASYQGASNYYGSDILAMAVTDTADGNSTSTTTGIAVSDTATIIESGVTVGFGGNENTPISLAGVRVSDSNAGDATLVTTLSVNDGTISVGAATGGATVGHNGTGAVTLSGTAAEIDASLQQTTYTGNIDFYGKDALSVISIDGSGRTSGPSQGTITVADTATITETLPASLTGASGTPISLTGVSVADNPNSSDTLTTVLKVAHGTIAIATPGAAGIKGNGTATVTLTGTAGAINAALTSADYDAASTSGTDTLSITTTDPTGRSSGTKTVAIASNAPSTPDLGLGRGAGPAGALNETNLSDPLFGGTSQPIGVILLYDDGNLDGGGLANAQGEWIAAPLLPLAAGAQSVTASALTLAGLSAVSAPATITEIKGTAFGGAGQTQNVNFQAGAGNNTMQWGDGIGVAIAGDGNNKVTAGNGADTVQLGNGNNTVTLGNGNDSVTTGTGNDTLTLGSGVDTVNAVGGNNTVTVGGGTDTITLGNGHNTLTAGNGIETITLGSGANTLILGSGNYTVSAASSGGDNTLILTEPQGFLAMAFQSKDELVFSNTGFDLGADDGKGTGAPQEISWSLLSTTTNGAFTSTSQRFAYNQSAGNLYYDAQGDKTGSTSVLVAHLTNDPHLAAANLFFIG